VRSIAEVEVLRDNSIARVLPENGLVFRKSGVARDIVVSARFRLPDGDKEEMMKMRRELLIRRNAARPLNHPNAVCVFKDPDGTTAAKLIEDAGLKGSACGNVVISDRHANLMVNSGGAEARDVLALIRNVQQAVRLKFNVVLELDLKLIGFEEQILEQVA